MLTQIVAIVHYGMDELYKSTATARVVSENTQHCNSLEYCDIQEFVRRLSLQYVTAPAKYFLPI